MGLVAEAFRPQDLETARQLLEAAEEADALASVWAEVSKYAFERGEAAAAEQREAQRRVAEALTLETRTELMGVLERATARVEAWSAVCSEGGRRTQEASIRVRNCVTAAQALRVTADPE